jgi:hypothetical protein
LEPHATAAITTTAATEVSKPTLRVFTHTLSVIDAWKLKHHNDSGA